MKLKAFFLSALVALGGLSAKAEWAKPNPVDYKVTEMAVAPSEDDGPNGQLYYFYWEDVETFLSQGNRWSAELSLYNTNVKKIFLTKYMADGVNWDGVSYRINNWVTNKSIWDHVWIYSGADGLKLVSDCTMGAGGACRGVDYYNFEWTDEGKVKIYVSDLSTDYGPTALGDKAYFATANFPDNTRVGLNIPGTIDLEYDFTDVIEWTVVDANAYEAALLAYDKSSSLEAAIAEAEEACPGIDLAVAKAVYANERSSVEDIQAAISGIAAVVREYVIANAAQATVDNPCDLTQLIVNPNYDTGDTQGWIGDSSEVVDGCAQLYNKTESFELHQEIEGLPNGVYRLNAAACYRMGNIGNAFFIDGKCVRPELECAYIYGESGGVRMTHTIESYIDGGSPERIHETDYEYTVVGKFVPNRQAGFTAFAAAGYYCDNEVYVVVRDGKLRIGIACDYIDLGGSWAAFNNWTLEFLGTEKDAYLKCIDQALEGFTYDDEKTQIALQEQYEKLVSSIEQASEPDEIVNITAELLKLGKVVAENIAAYNAYVKAVDEVKAYMVEYTDLYGPDYDFLVEYLSSSDAPGKFPNGGSEYILTELETSTEGLIQEAEYVGALLQAAIQNSIGEGSDITGLLANPNMALANCEGWNVTSGADILYSAEGLSDFTVAQAYKTVFDINQTFENMPNGIYELSLNCLFRWNVDGDWAALNEKVVPVMLYVNDFSTPIRNITSDMMPQDEAVNMENCYITDTPWPYDKVVEMDGKSYYAPHSTTGCSYAFRAGRYKQTVYGLVTDGKLTIGVRDPRTSSSEWAVFTNFRLTYQAKNVAAMENVLANLLKRVEDYQIAAAAEGISFYQGHVTEVEELAAKFHASSDEDEKYECLMIINGKIDAMDASAEIYRQLNTKLDLAYGAYWDEVDGRYTQEDVNEFEAKYYNPLVDAIQMGTISDEDAKAMIDEIRRLEVIDLVYVFGDLTDQAWGATTSIHPLYRQEDGTYQGDVVETINRIDAGGYGNRSCVYFMYQGIRLSAAEPFDRDITGAGKTVKINANNTNNLATFGGKWKITVSADLTEATFEPVDEPLYPAYFYVVGDLDKGYWKHDQNTPLAHQGNGRYSGIVNIGNTDGRFCIFAGEWPLKNTNWSESRLGTADGTVELPLGETVSQVSRYHNNCAWKVPAGTYVVTLDFEAQTIYVAPLEIAGVGTEAEPFKVTNLNDLVALPAILKAGVLNYVSLDTDLDMTEVDNWVPLFNANHRVFFNGNQHVVRNFHGNASFFGTLVGEVNNIGFENANVTAAGIVADQLGSATAFDQAANLYPAAVYNVWATGSLTANGEAGGAIAGKVAGQAMLMNVYTNVYVKGDATVMGGLLGAVEKELTIQDAYAAGSVANGSGIIGGGQTDTTPQGNYSNIVVWNNTNANFGPVQAAAELNAPKADLLDVVFNEDGTATDVSAMANTITKVGEPKVQAVENEAGEAVNAANFTCAYGGNPSSYYRVDYAQNMEFMQALSAGHTAEVSFSVNFDRLVDKEIKPFCATQAGGLGFLVSDANRNYVISYIIYLDGSYKWVSSTITPVPGVDYHVVASWDKEAGKLALFINGEKHAEVDAVGELQFPSDVSKWYCIGGDPGTDAAQAGANFQIATARLYSIPATAKNAYDLYSQYQGKKAYDADVMTDISYYDQSNWTTLQQTVVGWDDTLWQCDMQAGHYPVFGWDTTGGTSIEQLEQTFGGSEMVQAYGMDGVMLYSGALNNANLKSGTYVISTKSKSYKVLVK